MPSILKITKLYKMLTPQAIKEFKEIYLKEEGKQLSDEEAVVLANNLLGLFRKVSIDNSVKKKQQ